MTRPATLLRTAVLVLAGGSSLLLGPQSLAKAEESDAASARAEALTAPLPFGGARLNIAPLRLEFGGNNQVATISLTNTSGREVAVQSRLFAWSQADGEDQFAPSNALTISPSIISISPGATQTVRLLRSGQPSRGEKRFRLAVDQLPDPASAQSGAAEARLRFTLPVFLDRDTAEPARLEWELVDGQLGLANHGGATARVLALEVKTASGRSVPVGRNSLRYVQGGVRIAWPIENACSLGPVTITAQVDGQTVDGSATPAC
ncbi:fimbrial biogenesis chaperone [Tsuneonella sp. SYSU-LHT278]|uniref:fimbrial biogenesis chaperone n=1 Tax=Tsuneonella sediminis TaxID=3416089 RepID=UPI003F7AC3E9